MNAASPSPVGCDRGRGSSRGQATVEFALLLPVVALLALAIGQVAVVARDRVMLTHSAREGARAGAVGASDAEIRAQVLAAARFPPARVEVVVQRDAATVEVVVRYRGATDLPLVGPLVDDVSMEAVARMRLEQPP